MGSPCQNSAEAGSEITSLSCYFLDFIFIQKLKIFLYLCFINPERYVF